MTPPMIAMPAPPIDPLIRAIDLYEERVRAGDVRAPTLSPVAVGECERIRSDVAARDNRSPTPLPARARGV